MVDLVVAGATLYTVVLVPFKGLPILPGVVAVRPAGVVPIVASLLFGPAAAWGTMIGNVVGDLLGGTWTNGSYFGAIGNFFGLIAYRPWGNLGPLSSGEEPSTKSCRQFGEFVIVVVATAGVTAGIIDWG